VIPGLLLLAIAAVGAAYGGLVIRAAPKRRDNVVFGALALSDALMITWRAINVLTGERIVSESVTLPCSLGTMIMALLSMEFLYAFPGRKPLRWSWRVPLIVWTTACASYIALAHTTAAEKFRVAEMVFYGPATTLIFVLAYRALKQTQERAARVVILMLCFRWGFGFLAYLLAPAFGFFEEALWAETTFATLLSFVIIGTAVLRKELFSIRSAAAEVPLASTMALTVVLGGGGSILGVLRWIEPGNLQTAMLVGATLVPVALAAIGRALYPRIEANVLAGIDERRAKRLGVQRGPLSVEPADAIAEACQRIGEVGEGARVTWQTAANLPAPLAALLRTGEPQRTENLPGSCFAVPAPGPDKSPLGPFVTRGGVSHPDTYLARPRQGAAWRPLPSRTKPSKATRDRAPGGLFICPNTKVALDSLRSSIFTELRSQPPSSMLCLNFSP